MNTFLLVSNIVLLGVVLFLAFLLMGVLRALGVVNWRLDQMESMRPSRIGRDGLKIGRKALEFTLPSASGGEQSLHDFVGRKLLLVLTQSGCGPCRAIIPELNRLYERGEYVVLVVNNGEPEATRQWASATKARFPVLVQEKFSLSKRYEVFVTPFAFLIDEQGLIASKGIVGSRQYLQYVLTGAGQRARDHDGDLELDGVEKSESGKSLSSKEVSHV